MIFCLTVDQYTNRVGNPFCIPIERTWTVGLIKQTIIEKLQAFTIEYNAYRDSRNKSEILVVTQEQIIGGELNYMEFKTTRRETNYHQFSCEHTDQDQNSLLDFKKGESFLNLAFMLWLTYKEDNTQRNNQLKINNGSNNL